MKTFPISRKTPRASIWFSGGVLAAVLTGGAFWLYSQRTPAIPTIAFIPQTAGALLWEIEHFGASVAAEKVKCHLYWNAPTSESDLAGQVSLIDKVAHGKYQGLVLAPNHPLAMLAPLRRALTAGLRVVVVSSALDLPASSTLGYIVNDDEKMGELAAEEIARLLQGRGSIALIGITRGAPGVMLRVLGAERTLAQKYPGIQVVSRQGWAFNSSRAEEVTGDMLKLHPELKAVLSFTAPATRGVHAALMSRPLHQTVRIVGCEQDSDLIGYIGTGEIASIVAENTYRMGYEAVGIISSSWAGKPIPARSVVPPFVITRQNINSAEANLFTGFPK